MQQKPGKKEIVMLTYTAPFLVWQVSNREKHRLLKESSFLEHRNKFMCTKKLSKIDTYPRSIWKCIKTSLRIFTHDILDIKAGKFYWLTKSYVWSNSFP